jgi:hypothetical protein
MCVCIGLVVINAEIHIRQHIIWRDPANVSGHIHVTALQRGPFAEAATQMGPHGPGQLVVGDIQIQCFYCLMCANNEDLLRRKKETFT